MNSSNGDSAAKYPESPAEGVNMRSLCQTLARVLALLDETEYTEENQQDTVRKHDALPDQASDDDTCEAK
jgi:hypothetical protein